MRFLFLTPGTGHFFCGSCLRDNYLGRAMRELGHDATIAPLYLPHHLEDDKRAAQQQSARDGRDVRDVHMGGINMYLQQKLPRFSRILPGFVERWLDRPGLLRWASRRGSMTEAPDLGPMTVSMLRGEAGFQKKEVEKLVSWVGELDKPEVIVLSNVMLVGLVRSLKQHFGARVVCTMQGEQPFLDALSSPYREQAWEALRERAKDVDVFVPVSETYGKLMQERLGVPADRCHVVHNGVELADFLIEPMRLSDRTNTLGYLARMCRDKGLHTLVDAFVELKTGAHADAHRDLRLHAVGVVLNEDRAFVKELRARLDRAGLQGSYDFSPNVTREQKLAALGSWRVFSVPATYGESFGLYLLEAMASGLPVVQPEHGAFREVLELTEGGVLCKPDDAKSLAESIHTLLSDIDTAQGHADRGRAAVLERFSDEKMARRFADVVSSRLRPNA